MKVNVPPLEALGNFGGGPLLSKTNRNCVITFSVGRRELVFVLSFLQTPSSSPVLFFAISHYQCVLPNVKSGRLKRRISIDG